MDDYDDGDDVQFPSGPLWTPFACGATIGQHAGKRVRLWGCVSKVAANGDSLVLRTVDDVEIDVKLRTPLGSHTDGWVEAVGIAQGRSLLADELLPLATPPEEVDKNGHRALAHLLLTLDDPWNLGEGENME